MKKAVSILLVLLTLGMVVWGLLRPRLEARRNADLFARTSDAGNYKRTITVWGDDWLGYLVLRSPRFARELGAHGVGVRWAMEPDFSKRLAGLRDGKCDFAAVTLDSYLTNGNVTGWPGVVAFVIDESYGGDAVLATDPNVKNLDDLNRPGARGAFVGLSPSEFLLRSEISHFHLDRLRPGLEASRVPDADAAYNALRGGKVSFAVLWEPLVTKARNELGARVLIDTRQAQGLVIDLALASRRLIAEEPALAETVTRAYFTALHDYLNNPTQFTEAAARDSGKRGPEADTMLHGIRFATLEDNATDWLRDSRERDAHLAESVRQIQAILRDHQQRIDLQNDDPYSILHRGTLTRVAAKPEGVPKLTGAGTAAASGGNNLPANTPRLGEYYPALSPQQWDDASRQVRGTLLDEPIVFRPGQSEIPEDFQGLIRDAAPKLANYPNFRVVVDAHVSPGNSPEDDRALSDQRALKVKQFLVWDCHVPEERVLARGKGSTEPPQRYLDEGQAAWERRARRARIFLVGQ